MKSEKATISAKNCGSNKNLTNDLTMNNLPNFQLKSNADGDRSRRELLEKSKLSRLPELPNRRQFEIPDFTPIQAAAFCLNCGGRLDTDDAIQQSVKVCRKCLTQYAVIDRAIDEASKRKRREMLEKFAEVKR